LSLVFALFRNPHPFPTRRSSDLGCVKNAIESQRKLYPTEYATPVQPVNNGETAGIVASHTLIPEALFHAFSTFGALMSPDLPLRDRKSTRLNSSHQIISYAVFCL